jgi:hypothetical protein
VQAINAIIAIIELAPPFMQTNIANPILAIIACTEVAPKWQSWQFWQWNWGMNRGDLLNRAQTG